jgi:hypothetical protein
VEAHSGRLRPVPTLEADSVTVGRRYPPEVEAAGFFCVLEAPQNCANRHLVRGRQLPVWCAFHRVAVVRLSQLGRRNSVLD